jgi:ribosome assembly protein RRB1
MSKRAADAVEDQALKAGERPVADAPPDEAGEFEDEFEDEFESEDEILEAGVDGRPDEEREAEERGRCCCERVQLVVYSIRWESLN